MGLTYSKREKCLNGLNEVATKTNWSVGLVVDIHDVGRYVVTSIRGVDSHSADSRSVDSHSTVSIDNTVNTPNYITYYYAGPSVRLDDSTAPAPVYEITLRELIDSKIGGGRKSAMPSDEDIIIFSETNIDFTHEPKFVIRKCPCKSRKSKSRKPI